MIDKEKRFDNALFWIQCGIDLENRRIMLDEDVDEYSVGWLIRGVQKMVDIDSSSPIDLCVNSYGGSVYDGLALFDTLTELPCLLRTCAKGKIMSMGFFIFMAGDERRSSARSTFMHHEISFCFSGKSTEGRIEQREVDRLERIICSTVSDRTKKDAKWWRRWGKSTDKYFDRERAFELGVVTHLED